MPGMALRPASLLLALCIMFAARPALAYAPHQLSFADNQDVSSLNIFIATSANIEPLSELTMAEFVRFDTRGNPQPELVTEIPSKANHGISADGKTITWHLRRNVKWSDGAPFDADDVIYTYHVAMDPNNNIVVREPWNRLSGMTEAGKYTVVFHFKTPYALFTQDYFSTVDNSCILPKHLLGPGTAINNASYNALPVGIGPFRYTAYHRGDSVEMEANPYYWRGKPKLAKIVYKIVTDENTAFTQLQTGELDLWDTINGPLAQRVKTIPGKATNARAANFIEQVYFNLQRPPMNDPAVRLALAFATNRPQIIDKATLHNAIETQSVVPTMADGYAALPLRPYDPARAMKLLDSAGWKRGANGVRSKNGVPLTIDLSLGTGQQTRDTEAALLRDSWTAIGANVTIHPWAAAQYFAIYAAGGILQTSKFDVALVAESVGPVSANLNDILNCAGAPPNGFNIGHYCNPAVDAANNRYLANFDPAARKREAGTFQRTIDGDIPTITLYERVFVAAFDNRLTGYHPSAFTYWGDPMQLDI
jgi:peptide/nickel transport system substrate-binding protein